MKDRDFITCELCGIIMWDRNMGTDMKAQLPEPLPPYKCDTCYKIRMVYRPPNGEHRISEEELVRMCVSQGMPALSCDCGCTTVVMP